jgi:integrase
MQAKITERKLDELKVPDGKSQLLVWDEEVKGFGAVIGRTVTTFVVNYRSQRAENRGELERKKIGHRGEVSDRWDNHELNSTIARREARKMLGLASDGKEAAPRDKASGPTLREALAFHVGKMERGENRRGKVCSPRSIATLRGAIEHHLADYLERPLVALTADVLDNVRTSIEEEAERVEGSNPDNPPGRAVANRLLANVSAIWRSWHKRHGIALANPVERLTPGALKARENRISNADLPGWYAKVQGMTNEVRRDLQLVALFTGIRTDGVRQIRWSDVDFEDELVEVAKAKGDRPYTLPMVKTVRAILEHRKDRNAIEFAEYGGDHGYVFPSLSKDFSTVIAVAEAKERRVKRNARGEAERDEDGNVIRETYLPGIQACRKTFNSVAIEIGIPKEARESLMNHEGRGVNVRSYGFPENWDYLRERADQIEGALWQRIRGETPKRGRKPRLKSVA